MSRPFVRHSRETHLLNVGWRCDRESNANEDFPLALGRAWVLLEELIDQAFFGITQNFFLPSFE